MTSRLINFSPTAELALATLPKEDEARVNRVLKLLSYPVETRPKKLQVFRLRPEKLRRDKPMFVVRIGSRYRLLYHRPDKHTVKVDDFVRVDGLKRLLPDKYARL